MAVLWEQRKMVRKLRDLESASATRYEDPGGVQFSHTRGQVWIDEEDLLREVKKSIKAKSYDLEKILQSCIDKGFIVEHPLPEDEEIVLIQHSVMVSPNEGENLLNGWYFWLKYMPETFTEPSRIIVSVIITIITAVVTTILLYFGLNQ